jgi:hypothetical protein
VHDMKIGGRPQSRCTLPGTSVDGIHLRILLEHHQSILGKIKSPASNYSGVSQG